MKKLFMSRFMFSGVFLTLSCFVLTLTVFMTGCVGVPSIDIFSDKPPLDAKSATLENAKQAWASEDMLRVETYYTHLLTSGTLDLATQEEAWERIAVAADKNGHSDIALNALDNWLKLNKEADKTTIWQDIWVRNVRFLTSAETVKRADKVYNTTNSDAAYIRAVMILLGRSWTAKHSENFLGLLNRYYETQDQTQRIALEHILSNELRYSPLANLEQFVNLNPQGLSFPYTVILLEKARREVSQGKNKTAELAMLKQSLADANLVDTVMHGSKISKDNPAAIANKQGLSIQRSGNEVCIVLALPGQGPLDPISNKIKIGASAALKELTDKGSKVVIKYINTDAPDWLSQLNTLPEYCAIVGGPLQLAKYREIKAGTIAHQKNIFAFMPQLEGNDEGQIMWRFFSSPADQVNALLAFTNDNLGISSYGAFYPEDTYGLRMTSLFEQAVSTRGGNVRTEHYIQDDISSWVKQAKSLLDASVVNGASISNANFQAVFLPDSWKNMEMISTSLLFHGEDKQILLGTALWEQGLTLGAGYASAKYNLAIFPGVWNPNVIPSPLQDVYNLVFWNILGYDFVHFAYALNLDKYNNNLELQDKLRNAENITWTMAPLRWDTQGKASQNMIIFTPTEKGFAPVDAVAFKTLWENSLIRYNNRIKSFSKSN